MEKTKLNKGSFRDPSGFIFEADGQVYRQVNSFYQPHYKLLFSSGLYTKLTSQHLLIEHEETSVPPLSPEGFLVIQPQRIPFISYPYEWSFSQLKDAALLTLQVQLLALQYGMILKDASAYNIQFFKGKPIFIDTLSFEKYEPGSLWVAYRQFCEHFLAPLALMSYIDIRLNTLLQTNLDGIPLDLASKILPVKSYFSIDMLMHLHLHAKAQVNFADKPVSEQEKKQMPLNSLKQLVNSLLSCIGSLKWSPKGTVWGEYYFHTNYRNNSLEIKEKVVESFLGQTSQKLIWDFGANTGRFSHIAARYADQVIALDIDPGALEKLYLQIRRDNITNILPCLSDLTQPTPATGWRNKERKALLKRNQPDTILALALIHHLVIGSNIPMINVARLLHEHCQNLIIEFIPKTDSQVQRLLNSRKDIFNEYDQEHFETEFSNYFSIIQKQKLEDSERTMYLMHKK